MSDIEVVAPFWWCLDHQVVEGRDGCPNTVRLGPFDDRLDAERALETARERTEAWDHDPQWSDDADPDG
jgi:hypothetical protein